MGVRVKYATVVSVDFDLTEIEVGEQVHFKHDPHNAYDASAIDAIRGTSKEKIGYMSASPHTTLSGCVVNKELLPYIPSGDVPLIGTVVEVKSVPFRNGTIAKALKVEIYVVEKSQVG